MEDVIGYTVRSENEGHFRSSESCSLAPPYSTSILAVGSADLSAIDQIDRGQLRGRLIIVMVGRHPIMALICCAITYSRLNIDEMRV